MAVKIQIEPRADGFHFGFAAGEDADAKELHGPYSTEDRAMDAAFEMLARSLTQILPAEKVTFA